MKEDYVSFETAKLLKEKGFHELCHCNYHCYGFFYQHKEKDYNGKNYEKLDSEWYSAPTHQMAMKWLREVHNIDIIAPPQYDSIKWTYSAIIFKLSIPCTEIRLNDNKDKKEEAVEAALKYCLTNLI